MPLPSLCLVIDFVGVFVAASGLVTAPGLETDAVRMLGELSRVQDGLRRAPSAPTLTVVLAQMRPGDFGAASALLGEATEGRWSVAGGDWRKSCQDSDTTILLTREQRHEEPGAVTWVLGDAVRGPGDLDDVERRVREALRIPVARPVSPAYRSGAVVALKTPDREKTLLTAAFRDGAFDWMEVEGTTLVYLENTDVEDWLVGEKAAQRLTFSARKASLYLAPTPAAGEALWRGRDYALVSLEDDVAARRPELRRWESVRHSRL